MPGEGCSGATGADLRRWRGRIGRLPSSVPELFPQCSMTLPGFRSGSPPSSGRCFPGLCRRRKQSPNSCRSLLAAVDRRRQFDLSGSPSGSVLSLGRKEHQRSARRVRWVFRRRQMVNCGNIQCREIVARARGGGTLLPGPVREEARSTVSDNQLDLREDLKRIYGRRKKG